MQFGNVKQKCWIYEWWKYNNVDLLCILKFSKQCKELTFVVICLHLLHCLENISMERMSTWYLLN